LFNFLKKNNIMKMEYFTIGNHIYLRTTSEGLYTDELIGIWEEFSKFELSSFGLIDQKGEFVF
tara:strand:+ start:1301 stop:1489 length:189 start_codon:yes stop_codon:yes gene_type:complete